MRFPHLAPQSLAISLCFLIALMHLLIGSKFPFYFLVELHTKTVTPPYHFPPNQPHPLHLFPHLQVINFDMSSPCKKAFFFK